MFSLLDNQTDDSVLILKNNNQDNHNQFDILVETIDGLYTPLCLKLPSGKGPFPLILLASGNGGGGFKLTKEFMSKSSYTLNKFIENGYACAWIRYRAEVELGYENGGKLHVDGRQGRQLLNRGPLEYEDEISIIKSLGHFKEIKKENIGLLGMSHGGEMILKITSEFDGVYAAVASEPAAHEFLSLNTNDKSVSMNEDTNLRNIESMSMDNIDKVKNLINHDKANQRIQSINTPIFVMGRDDDHLQGIFELTYDLLKNQNKDVKWKSYKHNIHGFIFPGLDTNGDLNINNVQIDAINDIIEFFNSNL